MGGIGDVSGRFWPGTDDKATRTRKHVDHSLSFGPSRTILQMRVWFVIQTIILLTFRLLLILLIGGCLTQRPADSQVDLIQESPQKFVHITHVY